MQITLQIPDELERKLAERATQLNIPLETLILDAQWIDATVKMRGNTYP